VTAANTISLAYTAANRLSTASGTWGSSSFSYDAVGNRLNDNNTVSSVTTIRLASYPAGNNRMSAITQNSAAFKSFTYDGAGNITTEVRPGETFVTTYNKRNRPASVTRNAVAYASYGYNALEQLTSRQTSAAGGPVGTVHYIYDLWGHLLAEADGGAATATTVRDYIWMADEATGNDTPAEDMELAANDNDPVDLPLAVAEAAVLYQVHTDHLGRPIRMTDAAKATVWQASWKPWGEAQTISGTKALNLRFPGQYFQIETGYAFNWHRHYDPATGRYTQPDPLGFVDGPSVYAYAGNSPFVYIDPVGQAKKYKKPPNPNQKKGAEERQKSNQRERNVRPPKGKGEEHSIKPKGGIRFKSPFWIWDLVPDPCAIAPYTCGADTLHTASVDKETSPSSCEQNE
jgi:RHS repeat-associated protein